MKEKMDLSSMIVKESEEQRKPIDLSTVMPVTLEEMVTVRFLTETKKSLDEMAKKYKVSVSEIVRQLTVQGLELVKNSSKK